MKNKLLALFIFSITIFFLFIYFNKYFLWEEKIDSKADLWWQNIPEKEVFLEKKETPNLQKVEKKLTNLEKVEAIREKSKHFKIIEIWDEKFYFDIIWKDLVLKTAKTEKEIWVFSPILEKDIKIKSIYPATEKYLLSLWDKKYIFSLKTGIITNFDFKIPINYIKEDDLYYIISSEKWIFLLDKKTKKINYSYIFSDFVLHNKSYLAIIKSDDKKRLDKFNIKPKKDIIFFYNPISKKQKIVLESDISLEKIYKIWEKVFVENKNGEVFELKNF